MAKQIYILMIIGVVFFLTGCRNPVAKMTEIDDMMIIRVEIGRASCRERV